MEVLKTEGDILNLIKRDKWMIKVLKIVEKLNLEDCWIGAGFVRNKVWDYLHGYKKRTPLNDVDVIFYKHYDLNKEEQIKLIKKEDNIIWNEEKEIEKKLKLKMSRVNWSVKNQFRMNLLHNHTVYKNSEDALKRWGEIPTCIAVKIHKNKLSLMAPFGIVDLVNLNVKINPKYGKLKDYLQKIKDRNWKEKWPKLKIIEPI